MSYYLSEIKHYVSVDCVTFMDSSGIALLIRSQQRMQLLEGSIIVRNVPRQAKRVLDAAGIGRLISIQ